MRRAARRSRLRNRRRRSRAGGGAPWGFDRSCGSDVSDESSRAPFPMTLRTYREVTGSDASGILEQVTVQRERVRARLAGVKRVVAVMSGKGGVGKSYLTAAIARAAGEYWPGRVGVIDADLKSPTVARVLGAAGPLRLTDAGVEPARDPAGVRVISTEFLLPTGRPLGWREPAAEQFVWRGALEAGVLREFLSDVI